MPPAQALTLIGFGIVVVAIMAMCDSSKNTNPGTNSAAPAATTQAAPVSNPAYDRGYALGVQLGQLERPELVGHTKEAIIARRRPIENVAMTYSADEANGEHLHFVQGFCDTYADHDLVGGGRFTAHWGL